MGKRTIKEDIHIFTPEEIDDFFNYTVQRYQAKIDRVDYSELRKLKARTIQIPNEIFGKPVKTMEGYTFNHIREKEILLPQSLMNVPYECFTNTDVTTVTIPKSVRNCGAYMFQNCKKLKTVIFESGRTDVRGDSDDYRPSQTSFGPDCNNITDIQILDDEYVNAHLALTILHYIGEHPHNGVIIKENWLDNIGTHVLEACLKGFHELENAPMIAMLMTILHKRYETKQPSDIAIRFII